MIIKTRIPPYLAILLVAFTTDASAQHDPGRNAVRDLVRGEIDKCRVEVAKTPNANNSPISEGERHYVLAMAASVEGDVPAALDHAKTAVECGLPPERFVVGPRKAFEKLHADPEYQQWITPLAKSLIHGPMLGAVTDSSARIWVRTANEAEVKVVVVAESAGESWEPSEPVVVTGRTLKQNDFTAVLEVEGLKPETAYRYSLSVDGVDVGDAESFRTHPVLGSGAEFSVAFGGGAGFTPEKERMWTTIQDRDVNALLLLGDNVYIDDPTHQVTNEYCYYRRQSQPEWRSLVSTLPVYTIYDDHDFGMNDCVPGSEIETPSWKRQVWKTFSNNWVNPGYGGGTEQPGCWYDFQIGDVHFIMLDCRYYRDLKGGSMLGPVQKKWLMETLKTSTGTFKVLVSSVPWSPGVKGGSKDTWDGFDAEREEIFSFIENQRVDGVILMAADRHRSDMRKIKRPNGYDLYEVMSSRLTNMHVHGLVKDAKGSEFIMGYNADCSFGLMEFNTTVEDPEVSYTIINIDNQAVESRTLKRSELSFQ